MNSSDSSQCHGGMQPGLLVKDRLGNRKRIVRVQDDVVFWTYANSSPETDQTEHSTPYEEFADSHFVLPQPRPIRGAA
ncbi:MAG TPA: hypothetical protein VKT29_09645 [Terriglobales bacterium]|nr:hypothetical protein [Terriglobales bacterium]